MVTHATTSAVHALDPTQLPQRRSRWRKSQLIHQVERKQGERVNELATACNIAGALAHIASTAGNVGKAVND